MLPTEVSNRRAAIVRPELFLRYTRDVLLFCCSSCRVQQQRGGPITLSGGTTSTTVSKDGDTDFFLRFYQHNTQVCWIFSLPAVYCLDSFREIYTGIDTEMFGTGFAALRCWQFSWCKLGLPFYRGHYSGWIAVVPWQWFYDGVWDVCVVLPDKMGYTFVRDLLYGELRGGCLSYSAVSYRGLRRMGGFHFLTRQYYSSEMLLQHDDASTMCSAVTLRGAVGRWWW